MPDNRKRLTVYLEDSEKDDWEALCKVRKRTTSSEAQILIIKEIEAAKVSGELPGEDPQDSGPLSRQEFTELQKFFEFLIGKNGKNGFSITHIADFMGIDTTELAMFYKALKATKETSTDATVNQPTK